MAGMNHPLVQGGQRGTITVVVVPNPDPDPDCLTRMQRLWVDMIVDHWYKQKNRPAD